MPLKKGQTGNPNGRPIGSENKSSKQIRERAIKLVDENYETIVKEY